jgi:hypothetical protein
MEKPAEGRSWRVLLTEVGIVVLAVGIALIADQAMQWLNWRNQVADARQIIATEMASNAASAAARLRTQACIDRRLDQLADILDTASRTGTLPPVGAIGIPPRRAWINGAWESLMASQTAAHFPRAELASLAGTYYLLERLVTYSPMELEAWGSLGAMVGPGRRLDHASDAELRKALSTARTHSRTMTNLAFQMVIMLKAQNLPYSQSDLDGITATLKESLTGGIVTARSSSPMFTMCQPIGAVPPRYGQTPLLAQNLETEGSKNLPIAAEP